MKIALIITFLFICLTSFAQSAGLKEAVAKLDKALMIKDTATLQNLLHTDATYGHSSGWVQTKQDVLHDMISGKLIYNKIESTDYKWIENKSWATVRSTTKAQFVLNDKPAELNLHVLEVW